MTTIEERSDRFDERLRSLVSGQAYVPTRRIMALAGTVIILILVSNAVQFVILYNLNRSNHRVLTSQIPGLLEQNAEQRRQLAAKDVTIADQQYVLQEQAIPAIIKLATQVKALGGTPITVVLKPPSHNQEASP